MFIAFCRPFWGKNEVIRFDGQNRGEHSTATTELSNDSRKEIFFKVCLRCFAIQNFSFACS